MRCLFKLGRKFQMLKHFLRKFYVHLLQLHFYKDWIKFTMIADSSDHFVQDFELLRQIEERCLNRITGIMFSSIIPNEC